MYLHIPAEEKEKIDSGQLGLWSKTSKMLKSGIVCSLFRPDSSSQYKHSTKTTDSDHCHRLEAIECPSPSPNLLLLKQHWNHSSFDFPTIQSTTPLASLFYHVIIIIIISALPFILKNNTTWRVRQALVFHPKVHAFWGERTEESHGVQDHKEAGSRWYSSLDMMWMMSSGQQQYQYLLAIKDLKSGLASEKGSMLLCSGQGRDVVSHHLSLFHQN